jgi:hypothetical protein
VQSDRKTSPFDLHAITCASLQLLRSSGEQHQVFFPPTFSKEPAIDLKRPRRIRGGQFHESDVRRRDDVTPDGKVATQFHCLLFCEKNATKTIQA